MFDQEQIKAVQERAVTEKWPYPYLFNSLKSIGIERYEVDVPTHEVKFVGEGASLSAPAPAGFNGLTVAPRLDPDGLKAAIARSQARETTYEEFLSEIAAAGVTFYRVDMRPRTITYHGIDRRHKHVEPVPDTK